MSLVTQPAYPVCTTCEREIQRNRADFNGEPYHFGCLKRLKQFGRAVAVCCSCFSWLTEDYVTQVNFRNGRTKTGRGCGVCGSQELRFRPAADARLQSNRNEDDS